MEAFSSSLKKKAKLLVLVGGLAVALATSVYYNAIAPFPPDTIVGIVIHKDQGVDVDENSGTETPRYSVSIYLFTDDGSNDQPAASESGYMVNQEDFDSVRINDVVKGRVVPGPFKGFGIVDIVEVIPAKDVIDETIIREYSKADATRQILEPD